VLVFCLGLKVEGVALGTLVAQYAGLFIAFGAWFSVYGRLRKYFCRIDLFSWSQMKGFLSVNRDIFLRTLCLISVMLFFTSAGSWQGETILAVNTLLMQFYMIFSYIMDGFAYAGEAISGKYYGAGNKVGLSAAVRHLFGWGAVMTVAFTLLYIIGGNAFLSLLTDDKIVIAAAGSYFYWAALIPLAGVAAFIWDGLYIGCTKTRGMLISMFFSAITFFAVYYSLRQSMGNHGLWLAFIMYMAMRGFMQTLIWKNTRGKA
ncbi:MAG TPA: MATE family efflux transporter, partial [Prevotella sp.]|nr:MATE family efflux transporter [Prevotella sp.]